MLHSVGPGCMMAAQIIKRSEQPTHMSPWGGVCQHSSLGLTSALPLLAVVAMGRGVLGT